MRRGRGRLLGLVVLSVVVSAVAAAGADWPALGDEAIATLVDYLRIDTTNPPGNERPAAEFLKRILDREGIETRLLESAPGRCVVWARLRGTERGKAVVLLNHLDVVLADARHWTVPPFAGIVKDGAVWGRGSLDMKGQGVVQLMAMLALKRSGLALKRDVIFLGTPDEETGGRLGVAWLLRAQPDLVRDAGVVITEGGTIESVGGRAAFYLVSVSDKLPFGFSIRARGAAGHGSIPRPDSAVNRLVAGLARLTAWQPPIRVVDEVQRYFAARADRMPSPQRERYRDLRAALTDPVFAAEFTRDPFNNARVRSTLAVTMLEASSKINVVAGEAVAGVDVRLLPDENPQLFLDEVRKVLGDSALIVETGSPLTAVSSPLGHEIFRALTDVAGTFDPGAVAVPMMLMAFSDCYHFRSAGVPCYGFVPFRNAQWSTIHGNDERVSIDDLRSASRLMYELVLRLASQ